MEHKMHSRKLLIVDRDLVSPINNEGSIENLPEPELTRKTSTLSEPCPPLLMVRGQAPTRNSVLGKRRPSFFMLSNESVNSKEYDTQSPTSTGKRLSNTKSKLLWETTLPKKKLKRERPGMIPDVDDFLARISYMQNKYSSMSEHDLVLQGTQYIQELARREKEYELDSQMISSYYDGRQKKLSQLLDRL